MEYCLYKAAITGDVNVLRQNEKNIGFQKTPDGKTVLHLASQLGQTEVVEVILAMRLSLLSLENQYRETALHLATRGGHVGVVRVLIDHARKLDEDIESMPQAWQFILWRANVDEETALHEAVRYNQPEVLRMLIKEDPSYSHSANKIEETPLYIAANRGSPELVNVILNNSETPAYSGPNGTTALHGAVLCGSKECATRLLQWKRDIIKETDSDGQTALHYAASCNLPAIAGELLHADPSMAYVVDDNEEMTALHTAASKGKLSIVKEILLHCPDSCGMVNKNGQNILHMAISNHHKEVVEYILEECPVISSLINQKDVDGNTPCHLLTLSGCYVPKLIKHAMIDKGAFNNQRYTPLAILMKNGVIDTWKKIEIARALEVDGQAAGFHIVTIDTEVTTLEEREVAPPIERYLIEELTKRMSTNIIVATLIVTVSFAAGFTMPGGYIQSGSEHQGMAVLSRSRHFQMFLLFDTAAFLFSSAAVLAYMLTTNYTNERKIRGFYKFSLYFTMAALVDMVFAFIIGVCAVLTSPANEIMGVVMFACTVCFAMYVL